MAQIDDSLKIQISKIEAAHRQLNCAIELWFLDKDDVSIHTLIAAAYQVIHDVNEKRGNPIEVLFRPAMVKPEYQKRWAKMVREPSNFFKHADKDPEDEVDFYPFSSVMFMLYAIAGLAALQVQSGPVERAFSIWLFIHDRRFLSPEGIAFFENSIPVEQVDRLRPFSKKQFFETMMKVAAEHAAGSSGN
jgi:hypothetical protein